MGRLIVVLLVLAGGVWADRVAVFGNPTYVDVVDDPAPPPSERADAEFLNINASLGVLGHIRVPFTGITGQDWVDAGAIANLILVPDLENTNASKLSVLVSQVGSVLREYVSGGRGLIVHGDADDFDVGFLNGVFGFGLTKGFEGPLELLQPDAIGTAFQGGPSSIPPNSATRTLGNLPAGSKTIYRDSGTGGTSVALIPFGAGEIVYLGWDWFHAAPLGTRDGGWSDVLDRAVSQVSTPIPEPIPEPTTLVLVALGVGVLVRRRKGRRSD